VLERIVENWLTSVGERGYQAAFAQLVSIEGQTVFHAPVHHPHEHGKDLIARDTEGIVFAYQLKGGDIGLSELEAIQGQLFALAGTAITYPGLEPPRRPDRVVLVTNGKVSPPARSRLHEFNEGNRRFGIPSVEVIEKEHLLRRFIDAHGSFLPSHLEEFRNFLEFVTSDGNGLFPVQDHARFLGRVLKRGAVTPTDKHRAIASTVLLTSYVTGPWQSAENHLGVAQGWLVQAFEILRIAETSELQEEYWLESFQIAKDSARAALSRLLREASEAEDLIVPDMVEGLFYAARAALVSGYIAAFALAENEQEESLAGRDEVSNLLSRELEFVAIPGEAGSGLLYVLSTVLHWLGHPAAAGRVVAQWAKSLAESNRPGSETAIADPYHSLEEVLLDGFDAETDMEDESFAGHAYTLHVAIEWLARREVRKAVERIWPLATHLAFCEFEPSTAAEILSCDDCAGLLHTRVPPLTKSWSDMVTEARSLPEKDLPGTVWRQPFVIPFIPLIYPYRLTASVAKAIDYLAFPTLVTISGE